MKLIDALKLIKEPVAEDAPQFKTFLACGFTPLHLQTFLTAELRKALPKHHIQIKTGLFGDLVGNLERLNPQNFDFVVVAIEWADVDSRLGIRNLGGWLPVSLPDIVESARQRTNFISQVLSQIAKSVPTICTMPTLPLPPMFYTKPQESCKWELELKQIIASLAASMSHHGRIRVVSSQNLDEVSPIPGRFDVKSEIMSGFPYNLNHASTLAKLFTLLIHNPVPKKGLITDLDDTLWAGILGEVGGNKVSWTLEQQAHEHGLYQQFLSSLANAGVLIAVASKNDKKLVEQVFKRKDMLLIEDNIFPFQVHWSPKSISVQRILKEWNIGPDSVVFIDDSPMETAEVKAAFPQIECITFPKGDYRAIWNLFIQLRDLFGKTGVSKEDALRLNSIRSASTLKNSTEAGGLTSDDFLEKANAFILFTWDNGRDDRAFELINKTNQFNLNGRRFTEGQWVSYFREPHAMLLTVSYEDKYGPLGKIAALLVKPKRNNLYVDSWVMSCRAFSRRIEHQCLKHLFEKFEVDEIVINYQATDRNGPLHDFFAQMIGTLPLQPFRISKRDFFDKSPRLFHRVAEGRDG
jgi:FkbH-like protein